MTVCRVSSVSLLTTYPFKQVVHTAQQTYSLSERSPIGFNYTPVCSEASSLTGKQSRVRPSGRCGLTCTASQGPANVSEPARVVLRFPEICNIAESRGMHLSLETLGPFYTIECKDGNATGQLLATTNGFVVPALQLMHCDTMRIFTSRLAEADRDRVRGGSFFGLSLLIAAAVMSHGLECGCRKAEMLAINDDDHQHRRLVKYYKRLGFHPTLEVGNNGLSDFPHLLVWGGAGTRMNCIPEQFLARWAHTLRRMAP